jgi:hypothetical protein
VGVFSDRERAGRDNFPLHFSIDKELAAKTEFAVNCDVVREGSAGSGLRRRVVSAGGRWGWFRLSRDRRRRWGGRRRGGSGFWVASKEHTFTYASVERSARSISPARPNCPLKMSGLCFRQIRAIIAPLLDHSVTSLHGRSSDERRSLVV